jgi:hypothetical protein
MFCKKCGTNVKDSVTECPYCGGTQFGGQTARREPSAPPPPQVIGAASPVRPAPRPILPTRRVNGYCIAALICALFAPPLALIFAVIGLVQTSRADADASGRGLALLSFPIAILFPLLGWYWLIYPNIMKAREVHRVETCLSHVRTLSMALASYAQDHDQQLPPREGWPQALKPYGVTNATADCPTGEGVGTLAAPEYGVNANMLGQLMTSVPNYRTVVLCADAVHPLIFNRGQIIARHTGRFAAGFPDGHAEMLDARARFSLGVPEPGVR